MGLRHDTPVVRASFDDPNLVSCAGLEPVMRLAESCDLPGIVAQKVHLDTSIGSNPAGKLSAIVAGMVAGADSIDDLNVIRHGGMAAMFDWVYAPSTLGSFLREFTHGHVRQLQSAGRQVLVNLAGRTPLPPSADVLTFRSRISQNENSRSTQFGRWIEAEWAWVYLQDFRTEGGLQ